MIWKRLQFILLILILGHSLPVFAQMKKPNILIIITDDQRYDSFNGSFMPRTYGRIALEGVEFENAFVSTALCCPSRASIFTGLLARNHGIVRNGTNIEKSTFDEFPKFPEKLRASGYYTGLIGKYLNNWNGQWRKSEFDYWISFPKGVLHDWFNFEIIKNNSIVKVSNEYVTDKIRDYAIDFIGKAQEANKPFMLYWSTTAPHGPATPHPRHLALYTALKPHRPKSFDECLIEDKPEWLQQLAQITQQQRKGIDQRRIRELQTLAAVDEAIDDIMTYLSDAGMLDDTFILFLSDNGVFWGEHRLRGKDLFYEEASRVPFALRYPPLIDPFSARVDTKHLVSNIDIAPTIYSLAGIQPPENLDGSSLVPLIRDSKAPWRNHLLLEGWPDGFKGDGSDTRCNPPYTAIRTKRYLYAESHANSGTNAGCTFAVAEKPELYDLLKDPLEQENVVDSPQYESVRKRLKNLLDRYGYVEYPHK